ncbi:hypothetical protein KIH79_09105 [Bifidobacterium sp. 82T10]|uniref:Uncharacterized protein n=1 Tax=Bifidobacterium miconis TaxID=2834435 RepID=A0ABS6WG82_9BIFI|nr:hypothetical protein [Bifidobacterium miconis]MBW3093075.1 hypothetical protein [Bifidobacterium miconis]
MSHVQADMTINGVEYLKPASVSAMFGGTPTVGTLSVWRTLGKGPRFVKLGDKTPGCKLDRRPVAYPLTEVMAWAARNPVQSQTVAA